MCELAKLANWSAGKVYASVWRLERGDTIRSKKIVEGIRVKLVMDPKKWREFFDPDEIEVFKWTET